MGFLILGSVLSIVGYRRSQVQTIPHLEAAPVPKHPEFLSHDKVESLLTGNFQTVRRVGQIPDTVRESFQNFVDWPQIEGLAAQEGVKVEAIVEDLNHRREKYPRPPLDMADPEQELGSDDLTQGLPRRRLILCGFSGSAGFVLYAQGGFVDTIQLTVFDFEHSGAWGGQIKDYKVYTVNEIRNVMKLRNYRDWNQRD